MAGEQISDEELAIRRIAALVAPFAGERRLSALTAALDHTSALCLKYLRERDMLRARVLRLAKAAKAANATMRRPKARKRQA